MEYVYVPKEFTSLYHTIKQNCERLTKGYEQIIYLKNIVSECKRFEEYEFLYDEEILDDEELDKIFPGITRIFFSLIENPTQKQLKDTILLYHKEKSQVDYKAFFENARILIKEVNSDINIKTEEMKSSGMNDLMHYPAYKIKILTGISDIVRIFESMKKAGIISNKTGIKQIAEIFFTEVQDINSFEKKYNATKNRLQKEKSVTRSCEVFSFIKYLCEDCYSNNELKTDELISYLRKLQSPNII
jgi:hypothetical protein